MVTAGNSWCCNYRYHVVATLTLTSRVSSNDVKEYGDQPQHELCGRTQYVTYNNVSSNTKKYLLWCSQGSIPGPLLFLIYINDLSKVFIYTTPILFAGDTNIFLNGLIRSKPNAKYY